MKTQTAFTLVELMVALALAAILVVVALPSMRNILANNRITTKSTDFVRALNYARGEAISHATTMSVEPTDESGAWGNGWRIIDNNETNVKNMIKATVDFDDDIAIENHDGPPELPALQYNSRGRLAIPAWQKSITFWVCSKNYPQIDGRQITIRPIGTVSIERDLKYQCK
jgi:prepilin-type N-terminal cleavage/methylation domain-containing protein